MTVDRLPIVLASLVCVAATTSSAPDMEPGLWRNTAIVGSGKPTQTMQCRGPHQIELPETGRGCTIVRNIVSAGTIDVVQSCAGRKVTLAGRYTRTSMTLRATGVQFLPGQSTTLQINAERVAACDEPE